MAVEVGLRQAQPVQAVRHVVGGMFANQAKGDAPASLTHSGEYGFAGRHYVHSKPSEATLSQSRHSWQASPAASASSNVASIALQRHALRDKDLWAIPTISSSSALARPARSLASRLSEDGKNTVLVLEYGGSDIGPLIQMPSALSYPMNMSLYNWGFETEAEPHLGGRKLVTPRGKVFGGSSSINGMVYVRGHAKDFDTWSDMGATGWAYADVLPYFKRQENAEEGDPAWRGKVGPLNVKRGNRKNPLYKAFVEAGRQAGYPVTPDYNGQQQEGFGDMEMTVRKGLCAGRPPTPISGRRCARSPHRR